MEAATGGIIECSQAEANLGVIFGKFLSPGSLGNFVPDRTAGKFAWLVDPAIVADKVDKVPGKVLSSNDYTATEKDKLDGIAAGAEVNAVKSVNNKTGAVTLAKGDVGLGNVDNTPDSSKSVASAANLTTARTIQVNLGSTSAASFNGSANITPGVYGTLPLARGGLGTTTAAGGLAALGGAPKPTASGVGQWVLLSASAGTTLTLPSGGIWAYFCGSFGIQTQVGYAYAGVAAGGTSIGGGYSGYKQTGFAWRIG